MTELEKPLDATEDDPRIVLEPIDEDKTEVKKILDADPELEVE
jgi:hypothetical protein